MTINHQWLLAERPTRMVHLHNFKYAEHLDAALPQSKLHILPEAGHLSWADQPELFADMIIDWVNTAHK